MNKEDKPIVHDTRKSITEFIYYSRIENNCCVCKKRVLGAEAGG